MIVTLLLALAGTSLCLQDPTPPTPSRDGRYASALPPRRPGAGPTPGTPLAGCGIYDDGISENALGLLAGGETGWMHAQFCHMSISCIQVAFGSPTGPAPPDGTLARLALYADSDCDGNPTTPATGPTVLFTLTTPTVNSGTDVLNMYPAGPNHIASQCSWVLAACPHLPGELPAAMDETNPTSTSWVVGSTSGSLDLFSLNGNDVPPTQMAAIGFPSSWLLRATDGSCCGPPTTSFTVCAGDGSSCACGCYGNGATGEGCMNSTGAGALLVATGNARLGCDTLRLSVSQTTNSPGIFLQGSFSAFCSAPFSDGFKCVVAAVNLHSAMPVSNTASTAGTVISQHPSNVSSLTPGTTRYYQWSFKDPTPCTGAANYSNAVAVTWGA